MSHVFGHCRRFGFLVTLVLTVATVASFSRLRAQDEPPIPPAEQPAAAVESPVHQQFVRYQQDLSQADRTAVVKALEGQIGLETAAQQEAQFWYGLNAMRLANYRLKSHGEDALRKLADADASIWQARARNARIWLELQTDAPNYYRLCQFQGQVSTFLDADEHNVSSLETAAMLAQVAGQLEDTELALRSIQKACALADELKSSGIYTKEELNTLRAACEKAANAGASAETKAVYDRAESHRNAGLPLQEDADRRAGRILFTDKQRKEAAKLDPHAAAAEFEKALTLYSQVIADAPESLLAGKAELRAAECEMLLDKVDQAVKRLEQFLQTKPLGPYRGHAHVLLGDLFLEFKLNVARAGVEYNAVFKPGDYAAALKVLALPAPPPAPRPVVPPKNPAAAPDPDPAVGVVDLNDDRIEQSVQKAAELSAGFDKTWKAALAEGENRLGLLAYIRNDPKSGEVSFRISDRLRSGDPLKRRVPFAVMNLLKPSSMIVWQVPAKLLPLGGERVNLALYMAAGYREHNIQQKVRALLQRIVDGDFPDAVLADKSHALAEMGSASWSLGDADGAWKAWSQFTKPPYNTTDEAPDALLSYGCTKFTTSQDMKDTEILKTVFETYPDSDVAASAMLQYAGIWFDTDPQKALKYFQLCQEKYPKANDASVYAYWIKRCQEDIDKKEHPDAAAPAPAEEPPPPPPPPAKPKPAKAPVDPKDEF